MATSLVFVNHIGSFILTSSRCYGTNTEHRDRPIRPARRRAAAHPSHQEHAHDHGPQGAEHIRAWAHFANRRSQTEGEGACNQADPRRRRQSGNRALAGLFPRASDRNLEHHRIGALRQDRAQPGLSHPQTRSEICRAVGCRSDRRLQEPRDGSARLSAKPQSRAQDRCRQRDPPADLAPTGARSTIAQDEDCSEQEALDALDAMLEDMRRRAAANTALLAAEGDPGEAGE